MSRMLAAGGGIVLLLAFALLSLTPIPTAAHQDPTPAFTMPELPTPAPPPTAVPTLYRDDPLPASGTLVYQMMDGDQFDLVALDVASGEQWHITCDPTTYEVVPIWSPDGAQLTFVSGQVGPDSQNNIYMINADGTDLRQITGSDTDVFRPSFSPDGTQIVFVSDRAGNYDIYVMQADGGDVRQITTHEVIDGGPVWSPDGEWIVYDTERDGNRNLYAMRPDGSDMWQLTTGSGGDWRPAWSPDGTQIVFASIRSGSEEIYVINADGSDLRRLTHNMVWDGTPMWSPDGTLIVFDSARDGGGLFVMEVAARELGVWHIAEPGASHPDWTAHTVDRPAADVCP